MVLQVYEYRYNVKFSDTYASVSYTNHNFQSFSPQESCAGCSLYDVFVGVNRCTTPPDAADLVMQRSVRRCLPGCRM